MTFGNFGNLTNLKTAQTAPPTTMPSPPPVPPPDPRSGLTKQQQIQLLQQAGFNVTTTMPSGTGWVSPADGIYILNKPGSALSDGMHGYTDQQYSLMAAITNPYLNASSLANELQQAGITMPESGIGKGGSTGGSSGGSTGATGGTGAFGSLNPAQQSAIALMNQILDQAGLSSLAGKVLQLVQEGYTDPTVLGYLLQQTPEYQQRFSGNAIRVKNGLGVLSPAEYLATERAYQDVLRSAGLPSGFYDSPSDFADWIGKDVSAQEIQQRANDAVHFAQTTDPTFRNALQMYYGIDDGHIAAYFLDTNKALPLIQKQANAADIGAAAMSQGLNITDLNDALRYTDNGVTGDQARQAYGQIAGFLPEEQRIASQFGQGYTQQNAEQELLGQSQAAAQKRQRLNNQESALFSGAAGVGRYGLGVSDQGAY